jgi:hypothetical protein
MILLLLVVVVVVVVVFFTSSSFFVLLDYNIDINDRLALNLIFYNITTMTCPFMCVKIFFRMDDAITHNNDITTLFNLLMSKMGSVESLDVLSGVHFGCCCCSKRCVGN